MRRGIPIRRRSGRCLRRSRGWRPWNTEISIIRRQCLRSVF